MIPLRRLSFRRDIATVLPCGGLNFQVPIASASTTRKSTLEDAKLPESWKELPLNTTALLCASNTLMDESILYDLNFSFVDPNCKMWNRLVEQEICPKKVSHLLWFQVCRLVKELCVRSNAAAGSRTASKLLVRSKQRHSVCVGEERLQIAIACLVECGT